MASLKSDVDELDIVKLKNVRSVLSSLISKGDKLGIDKLKPAPAYIKKLRYLVEKEVVKKIQYNELVKKVNTIDTSELVKKQIMKLRSDILKVKYLVLLA